jgi:hypothetical protein
LRLAPYPFGAAARLAGAAPAENQPDPKVGNLAAVARRQLVEPGPGRPVGAVMSSSSSSAISFRKRRTALLLEHRDKLVRKRRAAPSPIGLRSSVGSVLSAMPPHLMLGLDGRDVLDQLDQRRERARIALRFAGRKPVRLARTARLDLVDLALAMRRSRASSFKVLRASASSRGSRRRGQPSLPALR